VGSKGPEKSVINYHYSLRINPEERSFKFLNSAYLTKVLCLSLNEHLNLLTLSSQRLVRVVLFMACEIKTEFCLTTVEYR